MHVLIVNTSSHQGGAAIAASRLMNALCKEGVDAQMLTRRRKFPAFYWERFVIWAHNHFSRKNLFAVSIANAGIDITKTKVFRQADIIHLHWINQGFLSLKGLEKIFKSGKPIVITMHDMWYCTGICHHARECSRYYNGCHDCPFLYGGGHENDLSHKVYVQKKQIYGKAHISFIACSKWLKSRAEQSGLLEGQHLVSIPNPLDTTVFKPMNKVDARKRFGLPNDKQLILFGAAKITDKRKGIDYFVEACNLLSSSDVEIVCYGQNSEQLQSLVPQKVHALGYISGEENLRQLYNAVDMFVTPSLEENLPNTIMESMACGTPCVGFEIGGIPEMITHKQNGYVAEYKDAKDFAQGIEWVLTEADYDELSANARQHVIDNYSETVIANKFIDLYKQRINGK